MSLSWNEVRDRAIKFTRQWVGETSERAEAKTFWDEFFDVFGIQRRTVASFEEPVRNLKGQYSYIDLFWVGKLLVEHKSFGKDLGKACSQAFLYIQSLVREGRTDEIPRYVILSDFARIVLYDLEPDDPADLPLFDKWHVRTIEIPLAELHKHIREFAFIKGEKPVRLDPEDPANFKAAEMMANLHDTLKAGGYSGHDLERFLVRVLFCLFADDTGIFDQPHIFQSYIRANTREDGSDLGIQLAQIFEVLDTPPQKRQKNLDEDLANFPYVNGGLFLERLPFAQFNRDMRNALLACCAFNWSKISPAVFGSLFQSVSRVYEVREPLRRGAETPPTLASLLTHLQRNGSITNADVRRILHVARNTSARMLSELVTGEWLTASGKRGKGAKYTPGRRLLHHSPIALKASESGAMGFEGGAMKLKE